MSLEEIREWYGVPAKLDEPVRYLGSDGVVTGAYGLYVRVRLGDAIDSRRYHPSDLEWPSMMHEASK